MRLGSTKTWGTHKRPGVKTMRINGHDIRMLSKAEIRAFRQAVRSGKPRHGRQIVLKD